MIIENQPNVSPIIGKGRHYRLMNDVGYVWENKKIIIRAGYVFDGASVPAMLKWFIEPMDPRVIASSLIHDALYTNSDLKGVGTYFVDGIPVEKRFSKAEADLLFKQANQANNMDRLRTNLAYWAVSLFGKGSFITN